MSAAPTVLVGSRILLQGETRTLRLTGETSAVEINLTDSEHTTRTQQREIVKKYGSAAPARETVIASCTF